jgi:protein RecA
MSKGPDLGKMFGDIMGDNDVNLGIPGFLDTGIPELNYALSGSYLKGGVPMGRLVEVFGPASCGKTFLATMVMIACQKMGGMPVFADHERSFEPILAESLGLDLSPAVFRYIRPETFEESMKIATNTAELVRQQGFPMDKPIVWIVDSVASAIPYEKLYDKDGNRRRDVKKHNMRDKLALATATSQFYPELAKFAGDNNMTVLLLNQIRIKPDVMYGDPTTTPGGQAAEFYASIRLSIGKKEIDNGLKGPHREIIGFEVTAKTIKNKCAAPFRTAKWRVMFNDGMGVHVDQIASTLDFVVRAGFIEKKGAYLVWEGKSVYQSVLEKALRDHSDGLSQLMKLIPTTEEAA